MELQRECVTLADSILFPFRKNQSLPSLPSGYVLKTYEAPTPEALNHLLFQCEELTHPPEKFSLALERSDFYLSIWEESTNDLAGFVRVTTDHGLNANLWNLVAKPGDQQAKLLAVLVNRALTILRRDMPGCSISVSAPAASIKSLQEQGFLLDPEGIRAMGLKLQN